MNLRRERRRRHRHLGGTSNMDVDDNMDPTIQDILIEKSSPTIDKMRRQSEKISLAKQPGRASSQLSAFHHQQQQQQHLFQNHKEKLLSAVADTEKTCSSEGSNNGDSLNNEDRDKKFSFENEEDPMNDDDSSVVSIELMYCKHCEKSFVPATYLKFCGALDEEGNPKCLSLKNKKRKVFNSAKVCYLS